ncbi:MAG: ATP-binding protein [Rikenellaceae bacterium]
MITNFRVKNFRSIVDMELTFTYDEGKAPNGYKEWDTWAFLEDKKTGTRAVPCLALYGANASGKSNIILALANFLKLVEFGKKSLFETSKAPFFQPNKIHTDEENCMYSIQAAFNDNVMHYEVACSKDSIIHEKLVINNIEVFSTELATLAVDSSIELEMYDSNKLQTIYKVECCTEESGRPRQVCLFLHTIGEKYPGLNPDIQAAFQELIHIWYLPVVPFNEINVFNFKGFEEAIHLLKQFDLDIVDVRYTESHDIKTYHLNNKKERVEFDLSDESLGTQNLLGLLGLISYVLQNGLTLVVDELDRSIHPLILIQIVSLFKSKEYNKKGAQLIFTTHTTDLLDAENLLRVSEVGIVNKTKLSGTTVTRLSEFEGLRNVKNFRKSYMNGEFRGIPYPFI